MLQAYGHNSIRAFGADLNATPDDRLVVEAKRQGCDLVLSLDNNRQKEVWSRVLLSLAQGQGRMLRIKLRRTELPSVPNLTRVWAGAYSRFEQDLNNSRVVLIQVGLSLAGNNPAKLGFEAFTKSDVAKIVQQEMNLFNHALLPPGSPRANARRAVREQKRRA